MKCDSDEADVEPPVSTVGIAVSGFAARLMRCHLSRLELLEGYLLFTIPNQKGRCHFSVSLKVILQLRMHPNLLHLHFIL
jgi:hypothetical protein